MIVYQCGCLDPRKNWDCSFLPEEPLQFDDIPSLFKHVRREHNLNVQFVGEDAHGHCGYCFHPTCALPHKNHRSFDTEGALLQHISDKHSCDVEIKTCAT